MSEQKKKDWQQVIADADKEESTKKAKKEPKQADKKVDKKVDKKAQAKLAGHEKFSVLEHPEYKELEEKLTTAEQKVTEHWNQVMSAKAEMENVRRRAERDVTNAHRYGLDKFLPELLPVVDSLERGYESCDASNEVLDKMREGLGFTLEMFLKVLQKHNVEQIDPLGKEFNPDLHEAMSMQEDSNVKLNTVLNVLQKGYTLNGRLLRPALVIVAK
ncbi:MAG: nucleotide exchange factor GrpE [Gammaproteobacteria bacterium]|nr:nucleotide exchange factor GrpE [Gammaproteobacteria bacterium]